MAKLTVSPKQARILSDMTQQDIAKRLDVCRQTYQKWEKNPDDMPIGKAKEFSQIVGREVDEIFFNQEST